MENLNLLLHLLKTSMASTEQVEMSVADRIEMLTEAHDALANHSNAIIAICQSLREKGYEHLVPSSHEVLESNSKSTKAIYSEILKLESEESEDELEGIIEDMRTQISNLDLRDGESARIDLKFEAADDRDSIISRLISEFPEVMFTVEGNPLHHTRGSADEVMANMIASCPQDPELVDAIQLTEMEGATEAETRELIDRMLEVFVNAEIKLGGKTYANDSDYDKDLAAAKEHVFSSIRGDSKTEAINLAGYSARSTDFMADLVAAVKLEFPDLDIYVDMERVNLD